MVKCSRCHRDKDESEFNFNTCKERLEYHCKECHKRYMREHYLKNTKYYKEKAVRRKKELTAWLQQYKSSLKCSQCPESCWVCLDFHHKDPNEKECSLANALNRCWSPQRMMAEIAKCEVLCSNCHRKLHHGLD